MRRNNDDLWRNNRQHCYSDGVSHEPVSADHPDAKDVTLTYLWFFSLSCITCLPIMVCAALGICYNKGTYTFYIIEKIQIYCGIVLTTLMAWITIVRFKTKGRVCSGDFVADPESEMPEQIMFANGKYII